MAVYTNVPAEELADFLARYDVGALVSAKGIAEGVENSNFLVETTKARFILTLYEKRVEAADLPYFLGLTAHLAERGLPVPAPIADRGGQALQQLCGRPACLIEFLPGISVTRPTPALARETGAALARMHLAAGDFGGSRDNALSLEGWRALADACTGHLYDIDPTLPRLVSDELAYLGENWPAGLPRGTIHADLFPDNVLALDGGVSGLIDFYFACTDALAYDLAVTHAAWCFDGEGRPLAPEVETELLAGYESVRPLGDAERESSNVLRRGAALRFLLTRAYDWINTPPDAMVRRHDPMAFARRLEYYRAAA